MWTRWAIASLSATAWRRKLQQVGCYARLLLLSWRDRRFQPSSVLPSGLLGAG
jgi:hypothetical protein